MWCHLVWCIGENVVGIIRVRQFFRVEWCGYLLRLSSFKHPGPPKRIFCLVLHIFAVNVPGISAYCWSSRARGMHDNAVVVDPYLPVRVGWNFDFEMDIMCFDLKVSALSKQRCFAFIRLVVVTTYY